MAKKDTDVERLRIALEANVLTSTIPLQFSLAVDTKRLIATDAAGTAFDFAVSDDSLQLLKAGAQDITGIKTIKTTLKLDTTNKIQFGTTDTGEISHDNVSLLKVIGSSGLSLETGTDEIFVKPAGVLLVTLDSNRLVMAVGKELRTAAAVSLNTGFNLPHGIAPSSPNDGDMWTTTKGLAFRISSATVEISEKRTFTATLTGVTGSVTVTAEYQIIGKFVHLYLPQLLGTSNTTSCTITGMPAEARPAVLNNSIIAIINNSLKDFGEAGIQTGGTITLRVQNGGDASWTASGTKGLDAATNFIYRIA